MQVESGAFAIKKRAAQFPEPLLTHLNSEDGQKHVP